MSKKIFREDCSEDFSNILDPKDKQSCIERAHNLSLKDIVTRY